VIIQQLFNGLALGMAYSLIAVGYSMVFGILRLINFSHGAIYAFSAHMALLFISMKFGIIPAILMSILITGILGILIDKTALEPLRKFHTYCILDYNNWYGKYNTKSFNDLL